MIKKFNDFVNENSEWEEWKVKVSNFLDEKFKDGEDYISEDFEDDEYYNEIFFMFVDAAREEFGEEDVNEYVEDYMYKKFGY